MMIKDKKIALIGGGISGLVTAYRLLEGGAKVTIFEVTERIGGLGRTIKVGEEPIEVYYHHFFSTDFSLFKLCRELGLQDRVTWNSAKMGYFSEGQSYDFSTPLSLLKFKPLSFSEKIAFAKGILILQSESSISNIEKYTAEEWLCKNMGRKVFEVIWKPLLIQKFGDEYQQISMALLWRKVQVRSKCRKNIFGSEKLGYLKGSSEILLNRLKERICELGGEIKLNQKIKIIIRDNGYSIGVNSTGDFDKVISTVAPEILSNLMSFSADFMIKLKNLKQLAVICVLLVLDTRLTDYYWLNIGDNSFPFGLLVEQTNFLTEENYSGNHIVYMSKYLNRSDRLYADSTDKEISTLFLKYLKRINRDFSEDWVRNIYVFRDAFAQPFIAKNYSQIKPQYNTPMTNFYWISTSHIYPDDRGLNYLITNAEGLVDYLKKV